MTNATKGLSRNSLCYRMSVLQRAQARLRATAQDDEGLELADAVDELHTELWFWQSAIGYTDNATVPGDRDGRATAPPHRRTPAPGGAGCWPGHDRRAGNHPDPGAHSKTSPGRHERTE